MAIRIYIVEDHPVMRRTLVEYLDGSPGMEICGTAASVQEALDEIPASNASVLLVDLSLPNGSGFDLLRGTRGLPGLHSIVLTGQEDPSHVDRAFQAGARGFVLKDTPQEIPVAIKEVMEGRRYLSKTFRDTPGHTVPEAGT
jgi:DNA-binding NarL/FixJ family response regulator